MKPHGFVPLVMKKNQSRPWLFYMVAPALIIGGFALMLHAATGGRLGSAQSLHLPIGFTTAAIGGLLLSRSPIAVFFLFLYALTGLVLSLREVGPSALIPWVYLFLLLLAIPLTRQTKL